MVCFAQMGSLFNHESPYRGETFVTKNYKAVGRISMGLQKVNPRKFKCITRLGFCWRLHIWNVANVTTRFTR